MSAGKQRLSAEHRRELEGQSVIDTAIVAERGYETITADQSAYLSALGIQVRSRDAYPGLLLPMFRATGERISAQFKPAKPIVLKRGRTLKYLSPLGQPNHIDVHPRNRERIRNMVRRGIPERVAMQLAGHKTRSVFERYNIVSNGDLRAAAAKLQGLTGTKKGQSEAFLASNESERSRIAKCAS